MSKLKDALSCYENLLEELQNYLSGVVKTLTKAIDTPRPSLGNTQIIAESSCLLLHATVQNLLSGLCAGLWERT